MCARRRSLTHPHNKRYLWEFKALCRAFSWLDTLHVAQTGPRGSLSQQDSEYLSNCNALLQIARDSSVSPLSAFPASVFSSNDLLAGGTTNQAAEFLVSILPCAMHLLLMELGIDSPSGLEITPCRCLDPSRRDWGSGMREEIQRSLQPYRHARGELCANVATIEHVALKRYHLVYPSRTRFTRCIKRCATVSRPPPNQEDSCR